MANCSVKDICGGCEYIGRPYEYQLGLKEKHVSKLLSGLCEVSNIVACEAPYYYRNKVHSAFKRGRGGKIIHGTYAEGSHRIVEHNKCMIENKKAQEIINTIGTIAARHKMSIYDERVGKGLLRRVLVRASEATGQIMVVLVIGSRYFTGKNAFIAELLDSHPEITTIVSNINSRHDSMILGNISKTEYGKGFIEDVILGKTFRISPDSFFQVNTKQAEVLYSTAISLAQITTDDSVLDCYCGTGTITLCIADLCKSAAGVEINPAAIVDARANARKNRISNVKFINADATDYMEELKATGGGKYDVVIMDPPRAGSTTRFISALSGIAPSRVIYVSCNPETLARDLGCFVSEGYRPVKAVPVDMFPWTDDVECCVLLERI